MNDIIRSHTLASQVQWADADELASSFLERYREYALRIANRIVCDPELAEDVAQESLIRAFKSWDRFTKAEYQVAWVRKIVVRRSLTALTDRRASNELDAAAISQQDCSEDIAVRLVLSSLEPSQRAILGLSVGERMSYQEIADSLEIPIGTVASRINSAKAAFRKKWEEDR